MAEKKPYKTDWKEDALLLGGGASCGSMFLSSVYGLVTGDSWAVPAALGLLTAFGVSLWAHDHYYGGGIDMNGKYIPRKDGKDAEYLAEEPAEECEEPAE